MFQTDTAREALRQKSVGDVFVAEHAMGQTDLARSQAGKVRQENFMLKHPEISHAYAVDLEKVKKAKTPEEVDKLISEAFQNFQHGNYLSSMADEIANLGGAKKKELESRSKYHDALTSTFTNVMVAGQPMTVAAEHILGFLRNESSTEGKDSKAALALEGLVNKMEAYVLAKPNDPTVPAYVDSWNKYSEKPYIYTYNDSFFGGLTKVPIPSIGGRKITASQLNAMKLETEKRLGHAVEWSYFLRIIQPKGTKLPAGEKQTQSGSNEIPLP